MSMPGKTVTVRRLSRKQKIMWSAYLGAAALLAVCLLIAHLFRPHATGPQILLYAAIAMFVIGVVGLVGDLIFVFILGVRGKITLNGSNDRTPPSD